ncbi:MAG: hypothetical protein E6J43_12950 [Chloroflexi bacterium]|nr:MAG: hypothetical protein E6J43_12950 [Chloroflexota bacterium]
MQMQKTTEKAQETVDSARSTVESARSTMETGAVESREAAAGLVERVGAGIRRQSQRAARATEQAGDRISSRLEHKAAEIRPERPRSTVRNLSDYLWRHPWRALLLFGLVTGVVALIAIPMMGRRSEEEAEFEGYTLPPRI